MNDASQGLSLAEAASRFLASLPAQGRGGSQVEVSKFVRWFGGGRPLAALTTVEVANYADRLSTSATDYPKKLELIRSFLIYAKGKGWTKTNLAIHFKVKSKKTKPRPLSPSTSAGTISLTPQGYAELKAELTTLHSKRLEIIDEIRKAAADKDFRENAPLAAAREQSGYLEGQIRELEATLQSAVVIGEQEKKTLMVSLGDIIVLENLDSNQELRCRLVAPKEVDPAKGKISVASPMGQAIIGRSRGDIVEVVAPAGQWRCQIKRIER